ncbi:HAD-like domain-containing protein [Trichoderma novae-zelandiae]
MWRRRIVTSLGCFLRSLPTRIQTHSFSSRGQPLPLRSFQPRQPSPSTPLWPPIRENPDLLPPLALRPATTANYHPATGKRSKRRAKMQPQSIQIPGLTLLNNLSPHAIAATSDCGLISAPTVPPQPKAKAPHVPPRKAKKENKKAKARRAQAETEAAASRRENAQASAPVPAPGQYGFSDLHDMNNNFGLNFNYPINFGLDFGNFNNSFFNNFGNVIPNNVITTPLFTGPRNIPRDERVAPSAGSGGVPEPTPLYIKKSLSQPVSLREPRRILVIMDLNGTLLYRPNKRNPFNFIQRPHARQFLDYCVDTFHVAIWSSARPENVDKMVSQLLSPEQRAKCVVIWGRDKFGLSPADYSSRVQCYKRLSSIWNDPQVAASHPAAAQGQRWDQTNTVLVDDSAEKGRSEPYNILQLPEFEGLANEPPDVLPQVHDYLNTLCYQGNISSYIREHPFSIDLNYRLPQSQEDDSMA